MSWQVFARRQHAPLSARLLQEAQRHPFFEGVTGIQGGLRNHAWLCDQIYIPDAELSGLREAVAAAIPANDWSFVESFAERCGTALAGLEEVAGGIAANRRLNADAVVLEEALHRWLDSYRLAMAFVPVFRIIDRVLSSYIPESERAEFIRADPGEPTEEVRERAALRELARQLARSSNRDASGDGAEAMIAAHIKRYGWLGTRWHLGRPFDVEGVRRRVAGLLATSGEQGPPDFELPPAPGPSADSKQQIVRDLAYLRSHRAEAINRAIWTAAPLFDSVSERLGVSPGEVPFFLPGELIDALGGSAVDRGQPERRRAAFATVLFEDAFSSATGDGEIEEIRRRLGLPGAVEASDGAPDADPAEPLLRGVVASPGRATGHVRLVRDDGDDHKVEKGDILVTTMTFPSLVGSMQRSAAIVTDDGGLLSHAAVTARELQKPCLIDTARATEVLSDRDLVEVDCEAGVVNHAGIGAGRRFGGNKS